MYWCACCSLAAWYWSDEVEKWYKKLKQDFLVTACMKRGYWHLYFYTNVCWPNHTNRRVITLLITCRPHTKFQPDWSSRARACDLHVTETVISTLWVRLLVGFSHKQDQSGYPINTLQQVDLSMAKPHT